MNDVNDILSIIRYVEAIMRSNANFFVKKRIGVLRSIFELIHDLEELGKCISPSKDLPEEEQDQIYEKYLMYPVFLHIVYPNMYFLPVLILLGALPHAFYSIRTALEAVAIALYADQKEELKIMNWLGKILHKSVKNASFGGIKDNLVKIFGRVSDKSNAEKWIKYIRDLYQNISSWIHPVARIKLNNGNTIATGLLRAATIKMFEYNVPSSFGLVLPTEYNEVDLVNLRYLEEIIVHFRLAIAVMTYVWSLDKKIYDRKCVEEYFNKAYEKYKKQYTNMMEDTSK